MRRRSVNRRLLGIMGVGVVLVAAHMLGLSGPLESGAAWLGRPVMSLFGGAAGATRDWFHVLGAASSLDNENQRLRSQVASLRQQVSQNTELKAENEELRSQLGAGSVQSDRLIAAEVIGYQPDNFRKFITIGRGSADGISAGMVVVQQGALVGTVQEVKAHTAKVFLLIDTNFRVAGLDQDAPNRPTGTIRGQIGNGLVMDKIAQTETVKPGDTIITSGLGSDIEKGLIIGRVQTVNKQDNGVFQTAQVTSDIQFDRLEIVYIIARPL